MRADVRTAASRATRFGRRARDRSRRRRAGLSRCDRVARFGDPGKAEDVARLRLEPKARMRRKASGLFALGSCPAGGIGIRARLRSGLVRVQIPGGAPVCSRERRLLAHRSGMATGKAERSLTTRMWQVPSAAAHVFAGARAGDLARDCGDPARRRKAVGSRAGVAQPRQSATAPPSEMRVRPSPAAPSNCSTSGEVPGLSTRRGGFESRAVHQHRGRSSIARAAALQAAGYGLNSHRLHQKTSRCSAAWKRACSGSRGSEVQILPARPTTSPRSSADQSIALRTRGPEVRILPGVPVSPTL